MHRHNRGTSDLIAPAFGSGRQPAIEPGGHRARHFPARTGDTERRLWRVTGQVIGEQGSAMVVGDGGMIEPFGQLALVSLSRDGCSETGGAAARDADAARTALTS